MAEKKGISRLDLSLIILLLVGGFFISGYLFFKDQLGFELDDLMGKKAPSLSDEKAQVVRMSEQGDKNRLPDELPNLYVAEDLNAYEQGLLKFPEGPVQQARFSLAKYFTPTEQQVGVRSTLLKMNESSSLVIQGIPPNVRGDVLFGLLNMPQYGLTQMLFDPEEESQLLFIDINQNGILTDEGEMFESKGDVFEVTVEFPLSRITGINSMQGNYKLWIYQPPGSGDLRYYPLTQLIGSVPFGNLQVLAVLAENIVVDGDYKNDGIYLDLNQDGKIDAVKEYVRPGQILLLNGGKYNINLIN